MVYRSLGFHHRSLGWSHFAPKLQGRMGWRYGRTQSTRQRCWWQERVSRSGTGGETYSSGTRYTDAISATGTAKPGRAWRSNGGAGAGSARGSSTKPIIDWATGKSDLLGEERVRFGKVAERYFMKEGVLCRASQMREKRYETVVVPTTKVEKVLAYLQNGVTRGHLGRRSLLQSWSRVGRDGGRCKR